MLTWLEDVAGTQFISAVLWTLLALFILVIALVVLRVVRSMTFGTFVAGGRNRKTRLAVMDATAVDSHRRLVLVRRDDVEHLILIGGPTDVVVEQHIRLGQQPRRAPSEPGYEPAPPPQAPRAAEPAPRPQAPRPAPVARQPEQRYAAPRVTEAPPPARAPAPRPAPPPRPEPTLGETTRDTYLPRDLQTGKAAAPVRPTDLDRALVDELNVSLDPKAKKPAKVEVTLEDEMNKLLGELTAGKRK
ncbi:MAG: hypothetical protein AB7I79_09205 [Rhizobiaceae bacterium]